MQYQLLCIGVKALKGLPLMNNFWQVDLKRSKEDGEKWYHQVSNEERAKFDEETLVNLNSKDKTSIRSQSYDRFNNEHTMV